MISQGKEKEEEDDDDSHKHTGQNEKTDFASSSQKKNEENREDDDTGKKQGEFQYNSDGSFDNEEKVDIPEGMEYQSDELIDELLSDNGGNLAQFAVWDQAEMRNDASSWKNSDDWGEKNWRAKEPDNKEMAVDSKLESNTVSLNMALVPVNASEFTEMLQTSGIAKFHK
ncbi:hypothetical protein ABZP36_020317 [Zizania latifolia]